MSHFIYSFCRLPMGTFPFCLAWDISYVCFRIVVVRTADAFRFSVQAIFSILFSNESYAKDSSLPRVTRLMVACLAWYVFNFSHLYLLASESLFHLLSYSIIHITLHRLLSRRLYSLIQHSNLSDTTRWKYCVRAAYSILKECSINQCNRRRSIQPTRAGRCGPKLNHSVM